MIKYIEGDATCPIGSDDKIIVHCCNDLGGWGRGFVLALSEQWKEPEQCYRRWARHQKSENTIETGEFGLGEVQFVKVHPHIWIANLIGQRGVKWSGTTPPIRYEAIEMGLDAVRKFAHRIQASVHMPRMGAGLAGGNWNKIKKIIDQKLSGINVTVYDKK